MQDRPKTAVIIVAAGKGRRMGGEVDKQFLLLGTKEILAHTVQRFVDFSGIDEIVLVTGAQSCKDVAEMAVQYNWKKIRAVVAGGRERQDSVKCGIQALSADCEIVLIHDGVRPFISQEVIARCIETATATGACVAGVPAKDTIKICDASGRVQRTPPRDTLWQIQTPQAFRRAIITDAYEKAERAGFIGTDDASVAEFAGAAVQVVLGSYKNIKITTREDLLMASSFLEEDI